MQDGHPRQRADGGLLHDGRQGGAGRLPEAHQSRDSVAAAAVEGISVGGREAAEAGAPAQCSLHGVHRMHLLRLLATAERGAHSADGVK